MVDFLPGGQRSSLKPREIVAFPFTDKASAELKERIVIRTRLALGELPGAIEFFVGTIHALVLYQLTSGSSAHLPHELTNDAQQALRIEPGATRRA